jgi:hypothetical protein
MRNNQLVRAASTIAVTTAAVLVCLQGGAVANAQTAPSDAASAASTANPEQLLKVVGNARQVLKDYAPASDSAKSGALTLVKNRIADNQLVTHLPTGARLAAGGAKALAGPQGTMLTIPIEGAGLVAPSALVAQIGNDGVFHASEMQFAETGPTSGVVTTWLDGTLGQHVAVTSSGSVTTANTPVSAATPTGAMQPMSWWDDFVQCLNDAGVPAWVSAAISAVCGIAGIAVACAIGVAVWYANAILTCYGA